MKHEEHAIGTLYFAALAILTGIVAGLGAVVFRYLIGFIHNLFFLGRLSISYDVHAYTSPSFWGPFVVLVPAAGALIVAFLVKHFAPEARGHGVPEVMEAIYYRRGVIRPIVAVIKSIASAITIGTGGSVGREGPIVQIGSSFGSTMGQLLHLSVWQRTTLIACGAGGGIAATFNTPIGGILFAVELIAHEVSARTLVPITLSTATASYVGRLILGDHPSFTIPPLNLPTSSLSTVTALSAFVGLGILTGLMATAYTRSIYWFEDLLERVTHNYYLRHAGSMLLVGIIFYVLFVFFGHYYTEGLGYSTVQHILSGESPAIWVLLLIMVLKLLATSLTLGSGGSGGIFSPGLFFGATLGAAYGMALAKVAPGSIDPTAFAVAGMAGVIGGATGAAVTAVVMIFEMTRDYNVIIPMTLTVAVSYGLRRFLSKESIYTLKLERRGKELPDALETNLHFRIQAGKVMDRHIQVVEKSSTPSEVADLLRLLPPDRTPSLILIREEQGGILGFSDAAPILVEAHEGLLRRRGFTFQTDFSVVLERTRLVDVLNRMRRDKSSLTLVVRRRRPTLMADDVVGFISRDSLLDALSASADMFARE